MADNGNEVKTSLLLLIIYFNVESNCGIVFHCIFGISLYYYHHHPHHHHHHHSQFGSSSYYYYYYYI